MHKGKIINGCHFRRFDTRSQRVAVVYNKAEP